MKLLNESKTFRDLTPGNIVFFNNIKSKTPPDYTGCNQIGIVTEKHTILYADRRKVNEVDFNAFKSIAEKAYLIADDRVALINEYFSINKNSYPLFTLGLWCLFDPDKEEVLRNPNMMPVHENHNDDHVFEYNWNTLKAKLRKGDFVFTFDRCSILSKLIAKLDGGSWSHVATYIGDMNIFEATTCGTVIRNIEVYKKKNIHVGLYRNFGMDTDTANRIETLCLLNEGKKYNYLGALTLGIKTLLNLERGYPTPNGIIYSGIFHLVDYL
jgi:hypothetical protein